MSILKDIDQQIFSACNQPPQLVGGSYERIQDFYAENDEITYFCFPPSALSGSSINVCTSSGEWSQATAPTCSNRCKLFPYHLAMLNYNKSDCYVIEKLRW